ncbi:hypothetical protein [Pelagibacterium sp.]|uniref:hypothetical protein n=1 Tax=Pelagibacterium sp. TaxID=1967288 RepID=UPI003BA91A09
MASRNSVKSVVVAWRVKTGRRRSGGRFLRYGAKIYAMRMSDRFTGSNGCHKTIANEVFLGRTQTYWFSYKLEKLTSATFTVLAIARRH